MDNNASVGFGRKERRAQTQQAEDPINQAHEDQILAPSGRHISPKALL